MSLKLKEKLEIESDISDVAIKQALKQAGKSIDLEYWRLYVHPHNIGEAILSLTAMDILAIGNLSIDMDIKDADAWYIKCWDDKLNTVIINSQGV
jgi:hypothetical protein